MAGEGDLWRSFGNDLRNAKTFFRPHLLRLSQFRHLMSPHEEMLSCRPFNSYPPNVFGPSTRDRSAYWPEQNAASPSASPTDFVRDRAQLLIQVVILQCILIDHNAFLCP
jgi:hypothetical protein